MTCKLTILETLNRQAQLFLCIIYYSSEFLTIQISYFLKFLTILFLFSQYLTLNNNLNLRQLVFSFFRELPISKVTTGVVFYKGLAGMTTFTREFRSLFQDFEIIKYHNRSEHLNKRSKFLSKSHYTNKFHL